MPALAPRRRRGVERLDDPSLPAPLRARSLQDIGRANTLLGGARAVRLALDGVWPALETQGSLLDVGTGLADLPLRARRRAQRRGVRLLTVGVDGAESLARAVRDLLDAAVCADARALPFADRSLDVVLCSQVLHHFPDAELPAVLRELDRVARRAVIVSDLRRSWIAVAGFWLATWAMRFHPVSRADGVTSILRGFTAGELREHVRAATGREPVVVRRLGFRLTAFWNAAR